MHIECSRQIDSSEPDAAGMYEYYYEYDLYRFTEGPVCFVARSYVDEPDEAHFLRLELDRHPQHITDADLSHPVFLAAQAHLLNAGKAQLRWLSGRGNGYESVPPGPQHKA